MKIRFAISPGGLDLQPSRFMELVDGLDSVGFDAIWLSDIPLGAQIDPLLGLAVAAGRTERLKLGANVVPLGRSPFALAKELAQLDQLSGGRLLVTLVPGLGQPAERQALGLGRSDRGIVLEESMGLLRQFLAGEAVSHRNDRWDYEDLTLPVLPLQHPLELWLGGSGPRALERVGRLADGWLGSAMTPPEVAGALATMTEAAAAVGRTLDPEHFGMSIPYGRDDADAHALAFVRSRRPDADPWDLLPVGADAIRTLVGALVEVGVSKFVLRPAGRGRPRDSVLEELAWLAEVVLPLQT